MPENVNFSAFLTRLIKICFRRSSSPTRISGIWECTIDYISLKLNAFLMVLTDTWW